MLLWYIKINRSPKQSSFTFCHWNLNDIAAHEFVKILLLEGHITERNFDIICYSKPSLILLMTVNKIG